MVVQASGIGYYGIRGDEAIDESTRRAATIWPVSAWSGRRHAPVVGMGVRQVVARTAPVMDRGSIMLRRMRLPFTSSSAGPWAAGGSGSPGSTWPTTWRPCAFLIENEEARAAPSTSPPHPLHQREFERVLGKVVGRPAWFPTPGFLVRLVFGQMAQLALTGQRVVPRRLSELGFHFRHAEPEAALREALS